VETASGKLVRVLRTQTARYTDLTHFVLDGSTEVFSFDPVGRYALVQNMQFGWMDIGGPDPGQFTPLPGLPAGHEGFLGSLVTDRGYSPVAPSIRSRRKSAWPRWRAYSSIMCR
jgi:hypothetical protein